MVDLKTVEGWEDAMDAVPPKMLCTLLNGLMNPEYTFNARDWKQGCNYAIRHILRRIIAGE